MFNPGLSIGQILKNSDIVDTFKCGNMGGHASLKNYEYFSADFRLYKGYLSR